METPRRTDALHPPVRQFCGSHDNISAGLRELRDLPALAAAAQRARSIAESTLRLFDHVVRKHHAEEEQELFVSVLRSCRDAEERERMQQMVERLTLDHRRVEKMWAQLRPAVVRTAEGKPYRAGDFEGTVDTLVKLYEGHARMEEEVFLPLADEILSRNANHMDALEVALHLRHAPPPKYGYI